jgi:hypothetical protein
MTSKARGLVESWLSKLREANPSSKDLGILASYIAELDR